MCTCLCDGVCVCDLACVRRLSTGACSARAEQRCGTVSGYLASLRADSCGTVIFDHGTKHPVDYYLSKPFVCTHTMGICVCVCVCMGRRHLLELICNRVFFIYIYFQGNGTSPSPLMSVCAQTARSA